MGSIYDYSNYREFLTHFYHFHKSTDPGFSHRSFLKKAGLTGPNFLKNVMDGKKNLSPASIQKFSKALGLSKKEAKYFEVLVHFNQAKTSTKKKKIFDDLSGYYKYSTIQKIQKRQYEYFSQWYNVVVREYIHSHKFTGNVEALAKGIMPNITTRQAEQAVDTLEKLKMIQKNENGVYKLTSNIVSTGPEVSNLGAIEYHKNMMDIAKTSIDNFSGEERYIRGITSSFSEETFHKVKTVVDQARKSILNLIEEDEGKKNIYQINMQLFPLTPSSKKRRRKK